jgi:hypothetical protein
MPKKPAKYGLKFFGINCVATSYLLDCFPYTGKSVENQENTKECGRKMVETLSARFYGSNRCIAMDNYFTEVPLAKHLYSNKLMLIGTMRQNKNEIPEFFLPKKGNEIFSSIFAFDSFMTLVSYTPKVIF